MKWIKLHAFWLLDIDFGGRRRVLRAMREFVESEGGVDDLFRPRGQFSFKERLAMAFFVTMLRSPMAVLLLPPALVFALVSFAFDALGYWN